MRQQRILCLKRKATLSLTRLRHFEHANAMGVEERVTTLQELRQARIQGERQIAWKDISRIVREQQK